MKHRFNEERATRIAHFAMYSLVLYAHRKNKQVVCVSKAALAKALEQVNLFERHIEFIAKAADAYNVIVVQRRGLIYFMILEPTHALDLSDALPAVAQMYADLSIDAANRLYDDDFSAVIEKIDEYMLIDA